MNYSVFGYKREGFCNWKTKTWVPKMKHAHEENLTKRGSERREEAAELVKLDVDCWRILTSVALGVDCCRAGGAGCVDWCRVFVTRWRWFFIDFLSFHSLHTLHFTLSSKINLSFRFFMRVNFSCLPKKIFRVFQKMIQWDLFITHLCDFYF